MHAIDTTVTGGAFAAVRDPGWHGLGVVTDEQVDALTLLKMAHADYDVFHGPVHTTVELPIAPGSPITVLHHAEDPNVRNVLRLHPEHGHLQILGQSSPTKKLWNNREIFVGWADQFIQLAKPMVSTCGVLHEGRRAFMCWRLPMDVTIHGNRDNVELWMLADTSYDGSAVTSASVSMIRSVCQNTVTAALKGAVSRYAIKRTANAKLDVEVAKKMLGLAYKYSEDYKIVAERMADTKLSVKTFEDIISDLWGPADDETNKRTLNAWDNKRGKLLDLFTTAPSNADIHGTAWGAYQAVAEYVDHFTDIKPLAGSESAARLWRGMKAEKTVEQPKSDIFDILTSLVSA